MTAPTHTVSGDVYLNSSVSNKLWAAIRHDSIAAFAKKYPATVTPRRARVSPAGLPLLPRSCRKLAEQLSLPVRMSGAGAVRIAGLAG